MLIDVVVLAFIWIIVARGGLLFKTTVQTTVSNACISHALASAARAASLCAGHAQQLGGESPLADLMEVRPSASCQGYFRTLIRHEVLVDRGHVRIRCRGALSRRLVRRTEHNKQCEAFDCDCADLLFPHCFPS